jgi:hypothetical protein
VESGHSARVALQQIISKINIKKYLKKLLQRTKNFENITTTCSKVGEVRNIHMVPGKRKLKLK